MDQAHSRLGIPAIAKGPTKDEDEGTDRGYEAADSKSVVLQRRGGCKSEVMPINSHTDVIIQSCILYLVHCLKCTSRAARLPPRF